MTVFLFWNLAKKAPVSLIGQACRDHNVDILILAELEISTNDLLMELNSNGEFRFFQQEKVPSAVTFFLRLPRNSINPVFDNGRISIQSITPPIGAHLIVAACHLPSKLHADDEDQSYNLRRLRREIDAAERKAGHQNTMVIGDFNLNPFEHGLRAVDGLHAVMDKRIAQRKPRIVQGEDWSYFYNPMWSRLGDESLGPPGTYFHSPSGVTDPYWHTLDQLLLRPGLLPYYQGKNLRVLTEIGSRSLLGAIGPDKSISDHLPLLIKLDTEQGQNND
jgi:hypothetical protein